MTESAIATYIKNHLSGSAAELELAKRASVSFRGGPEDAFFGQYVRQIEEDRRIMRELLNQAGQTDDSLMKLGRWAMERVVISRVGDFGGGSREISLVVNVEGALIGCFGRHRMWTVLEAAVKSHFSATCHQCCLKAGEHREHLESLLMSLVEKAFPK